MRPIDPVAAPEEGAEILIAGVPVEGIAPEPAVPAREPMPGRGDLRHPRGRDCSAATPRRRDCAGILDGSQGSPVFNPAGEAVAMVTTTTIGATQKTACALGLPCQVSDDGGISVKEDTSYMLPVAALAGCFPEGGLHASAVAVRLEDPASGPAGPCRHGGRQAGVDGGDPARGGAAGGFRLDGGDRGEAGQLGTVDCTAPEGWLGAAEAAALAAADAGVGDRGVRRRPRRRPPRPAPAPDRRRTRRRAPAPTRQRRGLRARSCPRLPGCGRTR